MNEACHAYECIVSCIWTVRCKKTFKHNTNAVKCSSTIGWEMSHIYMTFFNIFLTILIDTSMSIVRNSAQARLDEKCHIYIWQCHIHQWVLLEIWMSHVARMSEPYHTYQWGVAHILMHHGTHISQMLVVLKHNWMCHVTHCNESWHTHMNKSCHTYISQMLEVLTHDWMGQGTTKESWHTHMDESWHTYEW